MSREQGPHFVGMRPPAIAAGRRQPPGLKHDDGAEVAA
jgi:hypothetical protein